MISLADLQLYIGAVDDGTDAETILTDLEVWTVALISRATGKFFGVSESHTFYPETFGGTSIFLPDTVSAVASVSTRSTLPEDFAALDADQFEVNGREILLVDGTQWPEGRQLVKVVATRGYTAGAEPPEIRLLVKDLVNWQYRAGRKLALDDLGSPNVDRMKGWDRTIAMFRGPLYG